MLPYFLANVAIIGMEIFARNYIFLRMMPIRRPRVFLWGCSAVTLLLWTFNNYAFPQGAAILDVTIILLYLLSAVLFCEEGWRLKGLITIVIFLVIEIVGMNLVALVAIPAVARLGYPTVVLVDKTTSFGNAIMSLICTPVILVPTWFTARFLKRFFVDRQFSLWVLCFIPIPISQGIIVNLINRMRPYSNGIQGLDAAFAAAMLASLIADIGFFIGVSRIQRAEQLKEQVRTAEEQLTIQTGYYRQLYDNILTVNQIRHDLTNQLQAAYRLLELGEHGQVRSQLDQIQTNVCDRIGPKFCANLMVDAVLTDKFRLCQERGISFDVNASLPPELSIESTHLCSAFSNLLDISIQGAMDCPGDTKKIELRAALHAGYVVIRCTNTAAPPVSSKASGDPLRLHGLGLDILRKIAREYDGSLETGYQGGLFEASLILRFGE